MIQESKIPHTPIEPDHQQFRLKLQHKALATRAQGYYNLTSGVKKLSGLNKWKFKHLYNLPNVLSVTTMRKTRCTFLGNALFGRLKGKTLTLLLGICF